MKIYSNNKGLINRVVDIYGVEVKFDKTGSANVEDADGQMILKNAPNTYSDKPFEVKKEKVNDNKSIDQLQYELDAANAKLEKAKIQDENRKSKIAEKELEVKQVREALGVAQEEKKLLEERIETLGVSSNENVEDFKSKYELALKGLGELKAACKALEIPQDKWKDLKGENKEQIIEIIIEATKE